MVASRTPALISAHQGVLSSVQPYTYGVKKGLNAPGKQEFYTGVEQQYCAPNELVSPDFFSTTRGKDSEVLTEGNFRGEPPPARDGLANFNLCSALAAALIVASWLAAYSKGPRQLGVVQTLAFWLAAAAQLAYPFATAYSRACCRHQQECGLLLRVLQPMVFLLLEHQIAPSSNAHNYAAAAPYWAFALRSAVDSRALLLALSTFSAGLPFRHHLLVHGLSLAAVLGGNYSSCGKVCASGSPLGPHFRQLVQHLSLLAAPAMAATGLAGARHDILPGPSTPRFQCFLAWSFQAFVFGALLPTLVLFWRDRAGRQRRLLVLSSRARSAEQRLVRQARGAGGSFDTVLDLVLATAFTNGTFLLLAALAVTWIAANMWTATLEGLAGV